MSPSLQYFSRRPPVPSAGCTPEAGLDCVINQSWDALVNETVFTALGDNEGEAWRYITANLPEPANR